MADSNLDWGQNRDELRGWLEALGPEPVRFDPVHLLPGTNVFGANVIAGVFDFEQHRWLRRNADPASHLGHTYVRFDLEPSLFQRFMDEERLFAPGPSGRALCAGERETRRLPGGASVRFLVNRPANPERVWIVCVQARNRTDLALRSVEGRAEIGHAGRGRPSRHDLVSEGGTAWFRLEPGRHVLVVREPRVGRTFLLIGNTAALLVGIALVVRPSLLKGVETWANRSYSFRALGKFLEAMNYTPDRLVLAYPRVSGALITAGSVWIIASLAPVLFLGR